MHFATLYVLGVVFLATLIRSTFGFGEALVAVPLLALRVPMEVSVPLAVLLSATVAAVVIVQDHRKIHVKSAASMVAATLFGIPIGLLILTRANGAHAKAVLGALILLFSIHALAGRHTFELKRDSQAGLLICGFLAGIMGGAYGMNGPPLVVYASMRRWSPQHFRATLQGYFLPASLIVLAGYGLSGLLTASVMRYFFMSLPAAFVAILIGRALNHRIRGDAFLKYVYVGLAGLGLLLLIQG